jgi:hypothetical protein
MGAVWVLPKRWTQIGTKGRPLSGSSMVMTRTVFVELGKIASA